MKNFLNIADANELYCSKIICVLRNYVEHAEELNNSVPKDPVFFIKPNTALVQQGQRIFLPDYSANIHHEVEMAVVIGKMGKHIPEEQAEDYILGYAVAIDLTARDVQSDLKAQGFPWAKAKAFDQSCPISAVQLKENVSHTDLNINLKVNGEIRQDASTSLMIHSVPKLISAASDIFTLCEGDVILTGTPKGVAEVKSKDIVQAEIESVAQLTIEIN